jgi:hypothetical protein
MQRANGEVLIVNVLFITIVNRISELHSQFFFICLLLRKYKRKSHLNAPIMADELPAAGPVTYW